MRRGVAPLLAAVYIPEFSKGLQVIFASLNLHYSVINQSTHSSHALCKHVLLQLHAYCGWPHGMVNEWRLDIMLFFIVGCLFSFNGMPTLCFGGVGTLGLKVCIGQAGASARWSVKFCKGVLS